MAGIRLIYIVYLLAHFMCLTQSQATEFNDKQYESTENACDRCNCISKKSHPSFYELDCSGKGLQQTMSSYPDFFGTNQTGMFISISYSSSEFKFLKQLASTDATIAFTCENCHLQEIEYALFIDVPNIFSLNLRSNELTADTLRPDIFRGRYNDEIYEPISLVDLNIAHNKITNLQRNVFEHITKLRRLTLAHNPFTELNAATVDAIASIKTIEYLDLSCTNISAIPKELFDKTMPLLQELHLEGNLLTTIPITFRTLGASLEILYIGWNQFKSFNNESFTGLDRLKLLSINGMASLIEIETDAFLPLASLEVFNCSGNKNLTEFHMGSLMTAKNLKVIDLSNCSITKLDVDIPKEAAVEAINTNANQSLIKFQKLKTIVLSENPWDCDCTLYNTLATLMHYDSGVIFESENSARCATPFELATDFLADLLVDGDICLLTNQRKPPRNLSYDPPSFLRPRSILMSILAVMAVVLIGLVIGLTIVIVKKKLRKNDVGFDTTIRYTTVRNSTISTYSQN